MERQDNDFSLPDATKMQIVALAQAVIAVAVAFGVPISDQQSVALIALAAVMGTVLMGADAAIRRERARNADKLRPRATLTQTTTSDEGAQSTARVEVPLPEGTNAGDLNASFVELVKSFETVTKFLEAERARQAGHTDGAPAEGAGDAAQRRQPARRRRSAERTS